MKTLTRWQACLEQRTNAQVEQEAFGERVRNEWQEQRLNDIEEEREWRRKKSEKKYHAEKNYTYPKLCTHHVG